MLLELGVPSELEGVVAVQIFKASRAYADTASFDVPCEDLNGARLTLGRLPDEYLRLRALGASQLEAILSGITGDATAFETRFKAVLTRVTREFQFGSRPMAMLLGWQETPVRRRAPLGTWDWVDLVSENRRGVDLRERAHAALERLAASLSLGLGELLEDRVDIHSFWVAPGQNPVVIFREIIGSAEAFLTSQAAFPRTDVQRWIERISALPPALSQALAEPLRIFAACRGFERNWTRFTLGWAALECLGAKLGSKFDSEIVVEQRRCPACGAAVTERQPTIRPRLEALIAALEIPEAGDLTAELARITKLRGRSHVGELPESADLVAPERLLGAIVRGVFEHPDKIPA